jgi:hypothetical protein
LKKNKNIQISCKKPRPHHSRINTTLYNVTEPLNNKNMVLCQKSEALKNTKH